MRKDQPIDCGYVVILTTDLLQGSSQVASEHCPAGKAKLTVVTLEGVWVVKVLFLAMRRLTVNSIVVKVHCDILLVLGVSIFAFFSSCSHCSSAPPPA